MRTRLLLVPATVLALQLVRCGGDARKPAAKLPEVIYDGAASDEAWSVLWPRLGDATPQATLQLTAPTGSVAAGPPPTFSWGAQARAPGVRTPGSSWPLPFGPAVALAHEPPVTGTVILLEIHGARLVRVFTDQTSWTPTGAVWQSITGGTARDLSIRLYSAYLNENVIEEGPYVSPAAASCHVEAP